MQSVRASHSKNSVKGTVTVVLCLAFLLTLVPPQAALAQQGNEQVTVVVVTGAQCVQWEDEFEVSVVVQNVTGIFGGQFKLSFDPTILQGVEGSLQPGADLPPSLVAKSAIDNSVGSVSFAASRKGQVEGLSGDVVLATMRFRVHPMEIDPQATIHISDVVLGDRDANNIPVSGTQDLVIDIGETCGADVTGQVMLQGRTTGSFGGIAVSLDSMSTTTAPDGSFGLTNVIPATYTLSADTDGYLAFCQSVEVVAPLTELAPVELLAGDIDGNGAIDLTDAVAIGVAFGDVASNPVADLNADGAVNVLDLILMAVNFGVESTCP